MRFSNHISITAMVIASSFTLMAGCDTGAGPAATDRADTAELRPGVLPPDVHGPMVVPGIPEPEGEYLARRDDRAQTIKDAAASLGIDNSVIFAGVAYHLTAGLNHCWSEAKWGCIGPESDACQGGPMLVAPVGDSCPDNAGVGLFQVRADADRQVRADADRQVRADADRLSIEGNIESGIAAMLDILWQDSDYTPAFKTREDMLAWVDRAVPGTDEYTAWLELMAERYTPCTGDGCPTSEYLYNAFDRATRELITDLGSEFWTQRPDDDKGLGSSCTCYNGAYHTGQAIDPSSTYCGMRVCGGDNTVFECTAGGWASVAGISCDFDGCTCSGGSNHAGQAIDPNVTECHFRVCGGDYQFYSCTTEGWRGTGQSCPADSGTNYSCQCAGGIDQNGNSIPTSSTYCGFETCGVNGGHWLCSQGGWQKISNTCVSAPGGGGSTGFGYPLGDKSSSPAGGGGWAVWQVLAHYWSNYAGRHLAQDVGKGSGAYEPIYAVADGLVRTSAPNGSSYKNVIAIEHDMGNGTKVCSIYGHIDTRWVSANQTVQRGQQIGTVMNQYGNTHLHYSITDKATCDYIVGLNGGGWCGYDGGGPGNGVGHSDLANEPYEYTAIGTNPQNYCNISGKKFYSPSKFIDANHF